MSYKTEDVFVQIRKKTLLYYLRKIRQQLLDDLTVSNRPGTSYQMEIHLTIFITPYGSDHPNTEP